MADCVFCKIAAGEIPAKFVAETAGTVAFRDMSPKAQVHVLVIPRRHYPNLGAVAAAEPALVAEMVSAAAGVAGAEGVAEGYRIIANTGLGGGQTVFHAHLHMLAGPSLPGF